MVKNPPANAGDQGWGKSPGEGNGYPLLYTWPGKSHGQRSLEGYPVHKVAKSWTHAAIKRSHQASPKIVLMLEKKTNCSLPLGSESMSYRGKSQGGGQVTANVATRNFSRVQINHSQSSSDKIIVNEVSSINERSHSFGRLRTHSGTNLCK